MNSSFSFYEDGSRVLTPDAFQFVLESELKRAVRSQTFLTLVVVEAKREWDEVSVTADDGTVRELAEMVSHEVRDTDLVSQTGTGRLSLALLDADFDNSRAVIDRLVGRFDSYDFGAPLSIAVGAACYPTHAVDADSLRREAVSHPVVSRRLGNEHRSSQDFK
jgi:GGDEF domain-containing protein